MKKFLLLPLFFPCIQVIAQHDRVNDFNNINWLQSFNTIGLNKKWSIHAELQWRRAQGFRYGQQAMLRVGANYKLNEQLTAHIGYGFIETYAYGDYPIASNGTFPEHRIYEQLVMKQPVGKLVFNHRFRVEQRWLGRVIPGTDSEIEGWTFLHRFRYQFRAQYPFWSDRNKQLYGVAADEIFIGAGKNVGVNIFDQNRLFFLLGFRLNKTISFEAGYVNQTLQQGRKINGGANTVMQRNNGMVFGSFLNL